MKIEFTFDKGVVFVTAIAVVSTLIGVLLFNDLTAVLIAAGLLTITILIGLLFFSKQKAKDNSSAGTAIKAIAGLAASFPGWAPPAKNYAEKLFPAADTAGIGPIDQIIPLIVFIIASGAICLIVLLTSRPPLDPAKPIQSGPFRERSYQERFLRVARKLRDRLDLLDDQSNWTEENFEPLDAEVEDVSTGGQRMWKISNLLTAIVRDRKTRIFMVIGEPGSGKSTALRKLSRDLLRSAPRTGVISLYINLKEWKGSIRPDGESPTSEDLYEFIMEHITSTEDVFVSGFLERYLKDMIDYGRVFFIFDSFDEIPALLDQDETSELIEHISGLVGNMLAGAGDSRGVVASRPYRRPRRMAMNYKHLEVRPFSESQIRSALLRDQSISRAKVNEFMRGPPRWIASARNPFVANLISQYLRDPQRSIPTSQIALYESYVDERISRLDRMVSDKGLSADEVKITAAGIANYMFSTPGLGLEVSYADLSRANFDFELGNSVAILVKAKIMREGPLPERAVSFVHRRFYEFFLVQHLRGMRTIDLTAIEQDRRERDALVLYAETADEQKASEIIAHCWGFIAAAWTQSARSVAMRAEAHRAIYCLRFLVDAFSRTGSSALQAIGEDLKAILVFHIERAFDDPVVAKISVEASGLFTEAESAELIVRALEVGEPWVAETAIRSCRYIASDNPEVKRVAEQFVARAPEYLIKRSYKDLVGSFEISEVLKSSKTVLNSRIVFILMQPVLVSLTFLLCPALIVVEAIYGNDRNDDPENSDGVAKIVGYGAKLMPQIFLFQLILMTANGSYRGGDISIGWEMLPLIAFPWQVVMFPILGSWTMATLGWVSLFCSIGLLQFYVVWKIVYWMRNFLSGFTRFDLSRIDWKLIRHNTWKFIKFVPAIVAVVLVSTLATGAFVGAIYGLYLLEQYIDKHYINGLDDIFIGVFGIALLLSVCWVLWTVGRGVAGPILALHRDRRLIARWGREAQQSRKSIADSLAKLEGDRGRLEFVRALGLRVRQDGWKPAGEWPENRIPSYRDTASSELARLEEHWLGLDR